jgi:hypothetical protein
VGPVVDATVTPKGIGLLIKGHSPSDDAKDSNDGENWRDDVKINRRWEASGPVRGPVQRPQIIRFPAPEE